jgi:hypothetical protein
LGLREWIEKLQVTRVSSADYDSSHLGDDIALRTEWGPAVSGGASFRTHRLVHTGPRRAEFRLTGGAITFLMVFTLIGLGVFLGFAGGMVTGLIRGSVTSAFMIIPVLVGGAFAALGLALWWFQGAPAVFDKQRGEYWKGRMSPAEASNRHTIKQRVTLDRIHALQLLAEHCTSDDSSYYSYELNLVLKDATRLNVVDHGNRALLRKDAEELAKFLGRPLWDATTAR